MSLIDLPDGGNGMTTTLPFTKTQVGVLNWLGFEVGIA